MAISSPQQTLRLRADHASTANQPRVAVAGALLCVGSVAIAASGAPADTAFGRGLLQLLVVGLPIAAGLYALRAPANARLGSALLILGVAWSLTALGEASLSVPYTIGRAATWFTLPAVFYVLLALPDGRVAAGLDRALFSGIVAVSFFLFFATAFVVQAFPSHTPWASCEIDCPVNALFLLDTTPAFVADVVVPAREWLIKALWVGVVYSLVRRLRGASPLQKRAIGPVVVLGATTGVLQFAFYTARDLGAPALTVETLGLVWTLCIAALAGAVLFGLFWRRLLLAGALGHLGGAMTDTGSPMKMRDALAGTVGDPTLELWYYDGALGVWRDAHGRDAAQVPDPGPGRAATIVGDDDGAPAVAMIHDAALRDDEELLTGINDLILRAWRHERLATDLGKAMADLEGSRRRIAEAADFERVRIERDLHDGAQQRLIAVRIRLALVEELMKDDPAAGMEKVRALGFEVDEALEELRTFARGVYPTVLADGGLEDALRSLARRMPLPTSVAAAGVARRPIQIESAVYFVCAEGLQNAMKHAPTASGVWVQLAETSGRLHFEVRDDGPGFAPDDRPQRGLRNMRDRIEAVGGRLTIETSPGRGTRIIGVVDARPGPAATPPRGPPGTRS